jgi:hypothetical protein
MCTSKKSVCLSDPLRDCLSFKSFRVSTPEGVVEFELDAAFLVYDGLERGDSKRQIVRALMNEEVGKELAEDLVRQIVAFRLAGGKAIPFNRTRGDYREDFAPTVEQYRRRAGLMGLAYLPAVAFGLAAWLIPSAREVLGAIAFFLLFPPIGFALAIPRLECPACEGSLTPTFHAFGAFCPSCAGENLKPGNLLFAPECLDCGAVCSQSKGTRYYVVRACTHCGVWVDDQGV